MKIYDLVLEVRLLEKIPFIKGDSRIELIKELGGKSPDIDGDRVHTVEFKPKDKPILIVAQENRYAISLIADNAEVSVKKLKRQIRDIYKVLDYSRLHVARIGVKTVWIEETNQEFNQLVEMFKSSFYNTENKFISEGEDVAVNLTLKDGTLPVNLLVGPVKADEAAAFTSFPPTLSAEANILVSVDRYTTERTLASQESVYEFIDKSVKYGADIAKEAITLLKEAIS
jgi:hypothetical protein